MDSEATWQAISTIHQVVYPRQAWGDDYADLGLTNSAMIYFASRAAPLGPASAELTTAAFFGFSIDLISQQIPAAWEIAAPDSIAAARLGIATRALAPHADMATAIVDSLSGVLDGITLGGAPMAAAQMALEMPEDPVARLWHTVTVLRELRGDRHWAVLATAGLNGAAANALAVATGRQPQGRQKRTGWSDAAWNGALDELKTRGWVDAEGTATETGIAARNQLEAATSRATVASFDTESLARLVVNEPHLVALAKALSA